MKFVRKKEYIRLEADIKESLVASNKKWEDIAVNPSVDHENGSCLVNIIGFDCPDRVLYVWFSNSNNQKYTHVDLYLMQDKTCVHLHAQTGHENIITASTSSDLKLLAFTTASQNGADTKDTIYSSFLVEVKYPHRVFGFNPSKSYEKIQFIHYIENVNHQFIYRFLSIQEKAGLIELFQLVVEAQNEEFALVEQPQKEKLVSNRHEAYKFNSQEQKLYLIICQARGRKFSLLSPSSFTGQETSGSMAKVQTNHKTPSYHLTVVSFGKSFSTCDYPLFEDRLVMNNIQDLELNHYNEGRFEFLVVHFLFNLKEICVVSIPLNMKESENEDYLGVTLKQNFKTDKSIVNKFYMKGFVFLVTSDKDLFLLDCSWHHRNCEPIRLRHCADEDCHPLCFLNISCLSSISDSIFCFDKVSNTIIRIYLDPEHFVEHLLEYYSNVDMFCSETESVFKQLMHAIFYHFLIEEKLLKCLIKKLILAPDHSLKLHYLIEGIIKNRTLMQMLDDDSLNLDDSYAVVYAIPIFGTDEIGSFIPDYSFHLYNSTSFPKFSAKNLTIQVFLPLSEGFEMENLLSMSCMKSLHDGLELEFEEFFEPSNEPNKRGQWSSLISKLFASSTALSSSLDHRNYLGNDFGSDQNLKGDYGLKIQFSNMLEKHVYNIFIQLFSKNTNNLSLAGCQKHSENHIEFDTKESRIMSRSRSFCKKYYQTQSEISAIIWVAFNDVMSVPKVTEISFSCNCTLCVEIKKSKPKNENGTQKSLTGNKILMKFPFQKTNRFVWQVIRNQESVKSSNHVPASTNISDLEALFEIFNEFFTAYNNLGFCFPIGFHSKFAMIAFHVLKEDIFMAYVDRGILRLTDSFMKHSLELLIRMQKYNYATSLISRISDSKKYLRYVSQLNICVDKPKWIFHRLELKISEWSCNNLSLFSVNENEADEEGRLVVNDLLSTLNEDKVRKKSEGLLKRLSMTLSLASTSGTSNNDLEEIEDQAVENLSTYSSEDSSFMSLKSLSSSPIPIKKILSAKRITSEGIFLSPTNKSLSISNSSFEDAGFLKKLEEKRSRQTINEDHVYSESQNLLSFWLLWKQLEFRELSLDQNQYSKIMKYYNK